MDGCGRPVTFSIFYLIHTPVDDRRGVRARAGPRHGQTGQTGPDGSWYTGPDGSWYTGPDGSWVHLVHATLGTPRAAPGLATSAGSGMRLGVKVLWALNSPQFNLKWTHIDF